MDLILASNSPRRKQLLQEAGFDFLVKTIDFDEVIPQEIDVEKAAEYLAVEKNKVHRAEVASKTILTADTVVIFSGKILGKPQNEQEAKNTLKLLSGKVHQVVTGVCISTEEKHISFSSTTEVCFRELSEEEINFYVTTCHPMDKAGSYGIQDWIGLIGVEWIKGSYFNVVGLPIDRVYQTLIHDFGITPSYHR
jgi:septum formation protein